MNENNVILTGVPRSGTTLVCYLLNQLPNTIALHEPYNPFHSAAEGISRSQLADEIEQFFIDTRHSLLTTGQAKSKHFMGKIPDNPKHDYPRYIQMLPNRFLGNEILGKAILRNRRAHPGIIQFDKPLTSDFTLYVKHNAAYTALLGELTNRFPCYAIVRNPLAVLGSWNSINFDLRDGDMTITRKLDLQLSDELSKQTDRLERQCIIVRWFFSQYQSFLDDKQIIQYEKLVADPSGVLQKVLNISPDFDVSLENKNLNKAYNRQFMKRLGKMLLDQPSSISHYYPPDSISKLLEAI